MGKRLQRNIVLQKAMNRVAAFLMEGKYDEWRDTDRKQIDTIVSFQKKRITL